ncbi:MAG: hypothetical protein AAF950_01225 [Pseudomonadota bacterium]
MSFKKLAVAASATALLAGYASAQTFSTDATVDIANELSFDNGAVEGDLPAVDLTGIALSVGDFNVQYTISGSAVVDSSALAAGDLTLTGTGVISPSTPSIGGENNVITFPIAVTTAVVAADVFAAMLPVTVTDCDAPITVSVTVLDSAGTGTVVPMQTLEASAALDALSADVDAGDDVADLAECFSAIEGIILSDTVDELDALMFTAGQDSQLSLESDFEEFLAGADDSVAEAEIARIVAVFPPAANGSVSVGADLLVGSAASTATVTSVDFTATLTDITGLIGLNIDAGDDLANAAVSEDFEEGTLAYDISLAVDPAATLTGGLFSEAFLDIEAATGDDAAPIMSQTVAITDAELDLVTGFVDQPVLALGTDAIQLEGAASPVFDWVPDATFAVNTVFRGTGLGATAPAAAVVITNSSLGVNGQFDLDLGTPTGGQVIVNAASIQAAVGEPFGIGDVQIIVFSDLPTLDFDRLYAANGVISSHGNENGD